VFPMRYKLKYCMLVRRNVVFNRVIMKTYEGMELGYAVA
jgi:hypothetical protein